MIKPKALKPGACLAVVSPAGSTRAELVTAGVARLESLGYRVKLGVHALDRGPLYFAGEARDRVADLHAAFADAEVEGIVCTRGGWGSAELLPLLDRALILAHPKAFIGYSDQTSLHTWLGNEAGLVSFYGAMVSAEFSRPEGAEMRSWRAALGGAEAWSVGAEDGLRVLRPGAAEGVLRGGCISILEAGLGTPYSMRAVIAHPPMSQDRDMGHPGHVLFLEDVGVKPYQWDRMLQHLRFAGMLAGVTGIVLGDMAQCCGPEEQDLLERAILHALRDFTGPIAIGLRCGHVAVGNLTLPLGVRVLLALEDEANPRMHFLEAATEG